MLRCYRQHSSIKCRSFSPLITITAEVLKVEADVCVEQAPQGTIQEHVAKEKSLRRSSSKETRHGSRGHSIWTTKIWGLDQSTLRTVCGVDLRLVSV